MHLSSDQSDPPICQTPCPTDHLLPTIEMVATGGTGRFHSAKKLVNSLCQAEQSFQVCFFNIRHLDLDFSETVASTIVIENVQSEPNQELVVTFILALCVLASPLHSQTLIRLTFLSQPFCPSHFPRLDSLHIHTILTAITST